VVKQGESGNKFYVVEEGIFEVVLNGVVTSVGGRGSTVGPGQSFGELALIHDGPRHATLRTPSGQAKGTTVYALTRESFRHIVARQQAAKITEVKETLRKVTLLEGLSDTELNTVAASVKVVDFAPATMVIRKGEPGLEMYIIKEGDVVCEVPGTEPVGDVTSRPRSASVVATRVS
jgi:cAMP-dependent protein kinase regulator